MDRYDNPDIIYSYNYGCVNHSLVDKVYKYWWKLAFKAVPTRISANLLSMLGNIGSWAALAVLIAFGASAGPDHPWLFALCAFFVFVYHTIDCLDGMQARRLGISGPLGEFVDHWFDAMNVFFFPLGVIAAFPVVPPALAAIVILVSGLSDWVVLREVTKTGKLRFGRISAEEGITLYMLFLVSIPVLGYGLWAHPLGSSGIPPVVAFLYFLIAGHCISIVSTFARLKFEGLREVVAQVASTVPLLLWIVVGQASGAPRWTMVMGLLCIGFVGTRHVGDLLRVRLVGLRYPGFYPDLIAGSAAAIAACIAMIRLPSMPLWLFAAPVAIVMASTCIALGLQFSRTIARVRSCLGTGLFDVPAKPSVKA